jgi:glycosyltransferase involved in cell wall biosynthesis
MPSKILLVDEYLSFNGGSGSYIAAIAESFASRGHAVCRMHSAGSEGDSGHSNEETVFVPGLFGFNYKNTSKGLRKIRQAVRSCKPDIIYVHQVLNPHVISLLADLAPTIRFEHGFRLSCPSGRRDARARDNICRYPFSYRCMFRAHTQRCMPRNPFLALKRIADVYRNIEAHKKIEKIIVASGYIKDLLTSSGLSPEQIEIIPYFVDLPKEPQLPRTQGKPVVLFVGRMELEKGAECLLEAVSRIGRSTKVVLAGEGCEAEKLKAMAQRLPEHEFEFPGWAGGEALVELYRAASVVVVPSVWPEPFGIVGIEAMSHAVPVVAFDVGGISEWLQDGKTGFLVPRKNIDKLAARIRTVLDDASLAEQLGRQGRAVMEKRFTAEVHMEKLLSAFVEAQALWSRRNLTRTRA